MLHLLTDGASPRQTLATACAALSMPTKRVPARERVGEQARELFNECDAVVIFLLHLHMAAMEVGSGEPLAARWSALFRHL